MAKNTRKDDRIFQRKKGLPTRATLGQSHDSQPGSSRKAENKPREGFLDILSIDKSQRKPGEKHSRITHWSRQNKAGALAATGRRVRPDCWNTLTVMLPERQSNKASTKPESARTTKSLPDKNGDWLENFQENSVEADDCACAFEIRKECGT